MSRNWPAEHPDAPIPRLCPVCRLRDSYDEDTGECFRCHTGREMGSCPHDGALIDPTPAVRSGNRVLRWAFKCSRCQTVVVRDAETGEDASERSGDVLKHDSTLPKPAA